MKSVQYTEKQYNGFAAKLFDYFMFRDMSATDGFVKIGDWSIQVYNHDAYFRVSHVEGSFRVQCEMVPVPHFAADNDHVMFPGKPSTKLVTMFINYLSSINHPSLA